MYRDTQKNEKLLWSACETILMFILELLYCIKHNELNLHYLDAQNHDF